MKPIMAEGWKKCKSGYSMSEALMKKDVWVFRSVIAFFAYKCVPLISNGPWTMISSLGGEVGNKINGS
ncbi:hypothetical protein GOP47_0003041 [Adiantum capillus-veneris]|uniref:Uncharacterized protein n=1 Tax=Adiantum capillus-veneris TaxID=13818 RepID=A0A9D4VCY5_ADICA|nr:hypothetical protein GOP47_0003041 [Adiantum capillus-veneris]